MVILEVLWFLLDVLCAGAVDGALLGGRDPRNPREVERRKLERESLVGVMAGLALGLASGWAAPERLIPAGYFKGTSVVFVPVLIGFAMHQWGRMRVRRGARTSAIATWYGGALFGFGLAVGRLILLK